MFSVQLFNWLLSWFSYLLVWNKCYGNASTRKRTQNWVWVSFLLFSRIIGNPSKTKKCWGISEYFGSVSAIFTFDSFPVFVGPFPFFGSVSGFQKSLKFCLLIGFLFLGLFPQFLGKFPIFKKKVLNSVCWSVSSIFGSISSFFGFVSGF